MTSGEVGKETSRNGLQMAYLPKKTQLSFSQLKTIVSSVF